MGDSNLGEKDYCVLMHERPIPFNPFPNNKFWTPPIRESFQTSILNLVKMAESSPKG